VKKVTPKQGAVIRVAQVTNPRTQRVVMLRVTAAGRIAGRRYIKLYKVAKVATWVEVEATSWKQATAAVKGGRGKKVRAGGRKAREAKLAA